MEDLPISQWPTMKLTPQGIEQLSSCYNQAQLIGNNTATYLRLLIERGKMERRIVDGCKAILRLSRLYGSDKVEQGCQRALQGKRYNYKTIRAIVTGGLSDAAMIDQQEVDEEDILTHHNLRGANFFDKNN